VTTGTDPAKKHGAILIMDDSIIACKVLTKSLAPCFERVISSTDSTQLCDIIEREHIDCVVLDLLMPGVDGYAAMQNVFAKWPGFPIILVSADIQQKTRQKALDMGALAFFNKPPDIPDLIEAIHSALPEKQ
jgi:CheY-like chemotaxis protein